MGSNFSDTGKVDEPSEKDKTLKEELKEHKGNIWVDAMWTTYQESIDFEIPNPSNPGSPIRISRKISKGMSVKTDSKTPARIMNSALKHTLNPMLEEDKEEWLNTQAMRRELINTGKNLTKAINEIVDQLEAEDGRKEEPATAERSVEDPSGDTGSDHPEDDEGKPLF